MATLSLNPLKWRKTPAAGERASGTVRQIPRNSLALLMVAQVVVIVPLATEISLWVVAVCLFCGLWRTQVYRGRWDFPSSWVKAFLVLASFAGIALSGYRSFSLEPATSLLVLAFALKLVEMKSRRDAYLVIYIAYFLVACGFLFDQSIATTAYELAAVIVVTAAMVGLNQLQTRIRPLASLWTAAALLLQALPLTLVLFLLFPRIAPLWSIPVPSAASTGLSDRLKPGDIASLSQSDELAFRVVFDGDIPSLTQMYWRGLVYSEFLRGTWTVADPLPSQPREMLDSRNGWSYQVFLEPTQSRWLYSLDTPVEYEPRTDLLGDFRLVNREPVMSVLRYRVFSDPNLRLGDQLSDEVRQRETRLPPGDNPQIRAYGVRLLREAGGDAGLMIERLMREITTQPYRYTLSPPTLPETHSIDEFWFNTRAGFCTHYAGAMVFALRAAGIPARMVGGYQGADINPVTGHIVVRQYRAHSWVEAWLPDQGWTRFDPTGAVAPQRVESGLGAALSTQEREGFSLFANSRMNGEGLLSQLLYLADSAEHQWNLWVVGYDATTQSSVLQELLGTITPGRIGIAIGIGGGLSLMLVAISLFWRRHPVRRHPVERLLRRFSSRLGKAQLQRQPAETPQAYILRLAAAAQVDGEGLAERLQTLIYDPDVDISFAEMQNLRRQLRQIRFRLAFSSAPFK